MTDEELNSHFSKIKNLLSYKNQKNGKKHLEVELCYLQREIYIRECRRGAHEIYLRNRAVIRVDRTERRENI